MQSTWEPRPRIQPTVDETREFLEIANDFTNPLEIVREAISNSVDWNAENIDILFSVERISGESVLKIVLKDDGVGMNYDGLQSFFDLGNSLSRGCSGRIGEKGHGTKVYFNSNRIDVVTCKSGEKWHATMEKPFAKLHEGNIPSVELEYQDCDLNEHGTTITILGYNSNRRDKFTHPILKDYILWFTKYGGIDEEFGISDNSSLNLRLKGVDQAVPENIPYGHVFPSENKDVNKLWDEKGVDAPDWYVRKWVRQGHLRNFPEITYEAVFYVEGDKEKRHYNQMLKRPGPGTIAGRYTVQDRYGLWLCKDYIPIQRKNDWVSTKGYEFTRFHAFINCQDLRLTANRGSIENTPSEIMDDLNHVAESIYREITIGSDWSDLDYLRQEATGFRNAERDEREMTKRVRLCKSKKYAPYKEHILVAPRQEIGVYGLVVKLEMIEPDLLPFKIIDYDSHVGVDAIVKTQDDVSIGRTNLRLVEFKFSLEKKLNHLFDNIHSIVSWKSPLLHEQEVEDIGGNKRKYQVVPGNGDEETKYYLDDVRSSRKIEVIVLSEFLPKKLGITFGGRLENI